MPIVQKYRCRGLNGVPCGFERVVSQENHQETYDDVKEHLEYNKDHSIAINFVWADPEPNIE